MGGVVFLQHAERKCESPDEDIDHETACEE